MKLWMMGRMDESYKIIKSAEEIAKRLADIEIEATCYSNLGCIFCFQGDFNQGVLHLEKSVQLYEKVGNINNPIYAMTLGSLSKAYMMMGNAKLSHEYLIKAYDEAVKLGHKDTLAFVTYNMALVFACTIMFLCSVSITTAIANS